MDGSTKNSYKVSTKILKDNCIRIRVKVASCVCFSIFPTALKCQTMEKHTQSTQNPQDPKRPLRTVCGNVNDTRLRCEHNKYIDSFIRLFVTPSPLPAPPASDGLIHGHSLCVYSIRYQFSSGQQQKPSLLSVFFFSLPHLRLKLFVCSLWLSVYLSLCPLRFLFHWLLRRVSFNFNMCAVAPAPPPPPGVILLPSVFCFPPLSMTPFHVTQGTGAVPSTLSGHGRLFAQWARIRAIR